MIWHVLVYGWESDIQLSVCHCFHPFGAAEAEVLKESCRVLVECTEVDAIKVIMRFAEHLFDEHAADPHPAEFREDIQPPQPAHGTGRSAAQ